MASRFSPGCQHHQELLRGVINIHQHVSSLKLQLSGVAYPGTDLVQEQAICCFPVISPPKRPNLSINFD